MSFTIDDGAGLIECVKWLGTDDVPVSEQRHVLAQYRLGAALHVLGRLGRFRQTRQVTVERCWPEMDPAAECLHWARARELWHACYRRPFRVPDEVRSEMGRARAAQHGGPATSAVVNSRSSATAEFTGFVQDVFRHTQSDDGLTAAAIISNLPNSATRALTSSQLRAAVADALLALEEQSIVYAEDGPRGRGREARWRLA